MRPDMLRRSHPDTAWHVAFLTILIDMIGIGMIMPVMPKLIQTVGDIDLGEAAHYGGLMMATYAFMQFFMSPVIGNLSDSHGRRPVVLFSTIGYTIDWFIMALAQSLLLLFIGRLFSGAFAALYSTAGSIIADTTPHKNRGGRFGLLGLAFGLGFTVGPYLGGFLAHWGLRTPFFVAGFFSFLNMLLVIFFLPETLRKEKRRPFSWRRANPLGNLLSLRIYPVVVIALAAVFVFHLAQGMLVAVWPYYGEEKFAWTPHDIGMSLLVVGVSTALFQALAVKRVIAGFGEIKAAAISAAFLVFALCAYALCTSGTWIYVLFPIGACAGALIPSLQSLMSSSVGADRQGALQGAVSSLMSITMLISALLSTRIFKFFTEEGAPFYLPGAPLLSAAAVAACLLPLLMLLARRVKQFPPRADQD